MFFDRKIIKLFSLYTAFLLGTFGFAVEYNIDIEKVIYLLISIYFMSIFTFVGCKNPVLFLLFLVFLAPYQRFYLFKDPFSFTLFNCLLIIALLSILASRDMEFTNYFLGHMDPLLKLSYLSILCYVIFSFLPILHSPYKAVAISMSFSAVGIGLLFFVTTFIIDSIDKLRLIVITIILVAVLCSIIAILQLVDVMPQFGRLHKPRFGIDIPQSLGIIETRGTYGMFLCSAISFITLSLFQGGWIGVKKIIPFTLFIIITIGIMLSQSRSTYLAYFVCICTVILGTYYLRKRTLVGILIFILLVCIAKGSIVRISSGLINAQALSVYSRLELNKKAIKEILNNPIFGTGKGTRFREDYRYEGKWSQALLHNSFLVVARYGGLILCFVYVSAILCSLVMLKRVFLSSSGRRESKYALGLFGGLLACLVELNFYMGYSEKVLWFIVAAANSLYVVSTNRETGTLCANISETLPNP